MFAHEYSEIEPDIITLSKAVGGSLPLAVVVYNKELDVWKPGQHAGTFRGNQMAMAAGTASMRYSLENNLPQEAARKGDILRKDLNKLKDEVSIIGEVRGLGLMMGVELIDPSKPTLWNGEPAFGGELAGQVQVECINRGLVIEKGGRDGAVMRFLPPLIVSDSELKEMTTRFGEAILEVNRRVKSS